MKLAVVPVDDNENIKDGVIEADQYISNATLFVKDGFGKLTKEQVEVMALNLRDGDVLDAAYLISKDDAIRAVCEIVKSVGIEAE